MLNFKVLLCCLVLTMSRTWMSIISLFGSWRKFQTSGMVEYFFFIYLDDLLGCQYYYEKGISFLQLVIYFLGRWVVCGPEFEILQALSLSLAKPSQSRKLKSKTQLDNPSYISAILILALTHWRLT